MLYTILFDVATLSCFYPFRIPVADAQPSVYVLLSAVSSLHPSPSPRRLTYPHAPDSAGHSHPQNIEGMTVSGSVSVRIFWDTLASTLKKLGAATVEISLNSFREGREGRLAVRTHGTFLSACTFHPESATRFPHTKWCLPSKQSTCLPHLCLPAVPAKCTRIGIVRVPSFPQ